MSKIDAHECEKFIVLCKVEGYDTWKDKETRDGEMPPCAPENHYFVACNKCYYGDRCALCTIPLCYFHRYQCYIDNQWYCKRCVIYESAKVDTRCQSYESRTVDEKKGRKKVKFIR